MRLELVTTSERPDLAAITGRWRWEAFFRADGIALDDMLEAERMGAATTSLMPKTFVMLTDGEAVGMASLVERDLEDRPDLTPWLAGVFVLPEARRQGHATRLIAAVEDTARAAFISTLWLYTRSAEGLYARLGWVSAEDGNRRGSKYVLMRRELIGSGCGRPPPG